MGCERVDRCGRGQADLLIEAKAVEWCEAVRSSDSLSRVSLVLAALFVIRNTCINFVLTRSCRFGSL